VGKILPTILDTKYESILAQERSLAKAVTSAVIESKPVTVWEIMIPILFLLSFFRFKRTREIFTLNFLFTKKLALEAAFDMIKKTMTKKEVMDRIRKKTSTILSQDNKGIYSIKIRQRQLKEIDLLIDHYYKLLNAEGKDYTSMLKNAYQTREGYVAFLGQLGHAEKEVNRAATQTVRTTSSSKIVSKMEETTGRIRTSEAERIFSSMG
jgi:hypothetical protein